MQQILQQMFRKFQFSNRLPNTYSSENCRWVPLFFKREVAALSILINFESCRCYSRFTNHLNRPAYIEGHRFFYVEGRTEFRGRALGLFTKFSAITSVDRFIALSLFVNDSLKAVLKRQNRQYFVNLKKNELTNSELSLNNYFETKTCCSDRFLWFCLIMGEPNWTQPGRRHRLSARYRGSLSLSHRQLQINQTGF